MLTVPPEIPPKIVKNLSVAFCKVADKDCQEEQLKRTKKKRIITAGNKGAPAAAGIRGAP